MTDGKRLSRQITGESTSETMLIELGHDPNSPRWNEFVRIYTPILRQYVQLECSQGRSLDWMEQDDLVQEILASLVKTLPNFTYDRTKGRFRGYLRIAARRMVWRARKRMTAACSCPYGRETDAAASLSREMQDADARDRETRFRIGLLAIHLALTGGRVRPSTQAVFRRYVLENIPAEEVARQFRMTPNAVRQIKNRVLKIVQDELEAASHGTRNLDEIQEALVARIARTDRDFRLPDGDRL